LSIGYMVSPRDAENWINQYGLTYPVLADLNVEVVPSFVPYEWGTYFFPHSCIIDDEQTMQYTHEGWGYQAQIDEMIVEIEAMLIPEIGSSTTDIEFSGVEAGQSDSYDVYIDNTRLGILNVTGAYVAGASYSVTFTAGEIYAVDDSLMITVTFAPDDPGSYDDLLTVESDAGTLEIPIDAFVGIKDTPLGESPEAFTLHGNYPNPFNPETTIEFALPEAASVNLEVFSILGERVSFMEYGELKAGVQTLNYNAAGLTAGVYFYRLTAGNFSAVEKMILLK